MGGCAEKQAAGEPDLGFAPPTALPGSKPRQDNAAQQLLITGGSVSLTCSHGADCQLALRWGLQPGAALDLDACAVALNPLGIVAGAAFYNNLSALDGALTHRGDSRDGSAEGDDETIDIDLDALPAQGVCSLALCVFAHKSGSLDSVNELKAILRTKDASGGWVDSVSVTLNELAGSALSTVTGVLVAGLYSGDKGKTWSLRQLGHTLEGPRDFQAGIDDIRDACFAANIIRKAPPGKVLTQSETYHMQKRDEAGVAVDKVIVGLGWELAKGSQKIDLDASCIMLGAPAATGFRRVVDTVWHNDTQAPGVVHKGDNRTGDGAGDDEQIVIDLRRLQAGVERLVVTINSYNGSFATVQRAWARVLDAASGKELAHYPLQGETSEAIVLCAFDKRDGQWVFEAVGKPCRGKTAKSGECVDAVRGRPHRKIIDMSPGQSILLPFNMYDDDEDVLSILDEWGCRNEWLWLDATVLLFGKDGTKLGEIDYNDKAWPTSGASIITHSGDRQDEAKRHGSHEIRMKMLRLTNERPDVFSVLLVISAYSQDLSAAVKPFISLRDSDEAEVVRFAPDTNYRATSIQMVDLHRHRVGWVLTAHGLLGSGRANAYGPIEAAYRSVLKQIVAAGDAKDLKIDYERVKQEVGQGSFPPGPPVS